MRLHPVDHADPVRLRGFAVKPDGEPEDLADLDDLHGRPDRAAHGGFGHAVVLEHRELPLDRAAAVAPHRGEDERSSPERLHVIHGGPDDDVDVHHASAPGGQRDGLTRSDRQGHARERLAHGCRHVGQHRAGELLLDPDHSRKPGRARNSDELHGSPPRVPASGSRTGSGSGTARLFYITSR